MVQYPHTRFCPVSGEVSITCEDDILDMIATQIRIAGTSRVYVERVRWQGFEGACSHAIASARYARDVLNLGREGRPDAIRALVREHLREIARCEAIAYQSEPEHWTHLTGAPRID